MKFNRRWLAIAPLIVAAVLAVVTASAGGARTKRGVSGSITVWVDAVRLPAAKAYVKAHPKVKVKIVTFDGDGNGATTLQAKIQLWNRTGNGWPDVIFSEQANDPGLDGIQAVRLRGARHGPHPGEGPQEVARAVARPVHGERQGDLRPGQPRPDGALVRQDADGQVRLHRPDDVAGVGGNRRRRSPPSTPATSSGTPATRTAPGRTCGPTSARSARCRRTAASASTRGIRIAPGWPACSIR